MAQHRRFPWLSEPLQELAAVAAGLNLAVVQFNSGSSRNSNNGIRVFRSKGGAHADFFGDFLHGGHLVHVRTAAELSAFLTGYRYGAGDAQHAS